jgi:hypothetical protein
MSTAAESRSVVGRVASLSVATTTPGRTGGGRYSRNDRDVSCFKPEIAALDFEAGLIVDGELVASSGSDTSAGVLVECSAHYNTQWPRRTLQLRPPRPASAVPSTVGSRTRP